MQTISKFSLIHDHVEICKQEDLAKCNSILEVKETVFREMGVAVDTQVVSMDKVLLNDNLTIDETNFFSNSFPATNSGKHIRHA